MTRRSIFTLRSLIVPCALCICIYFWAVVLFIQNASPSSNSSEFEQLFTIQTEGCEIPAMTPLDPSIREFVTSPNPVKCDEPSASLLGHNDTHIWVKAKIAQQYKNNVTCCYRSFHRTQYDVSPSVVDVRRVQYHPCINFSHHMTVNDEFVRVTCHVSSKEIHDQFFLFARKRDFMAHNDVKELINDNSSYNVLVMGIDSVSRLNLYRTMPKTVNFLKNIGAIEFLGYNKVGDNTFPNLIPMLLGISVEELPRTCVPHKDSKFDKCPFVWDRFKEAGYYTVLGEDSSWRDRFSGSPTDYYLHTYFNEAEKSMRKRNKILCSNDKYFFQVLLDYVDGLTTTLKSSKLFGFFWEVSMSHDCLNDAAVMDDSYVEFLKKLQDKKYMEQTILIFVSDHGMRFGNITHTKQGWFESRLPFLYILAPPSFRNKYSEAFNNLNINSRRLTTPYNLHATLNDLTYPDNINNEKILSRSKEEYWYDRSISFFLAIPGNRTCQIAGISDHFCTCHENIPISIENALVKEGSVYLIKYINQMLAAHEHCAELSLDKLMDAREVIVGKADRDEAGWREVLVVVRTWPGQGEFEATLRHYDGGQWALAGQVCRLNLYGNQSHCIGDDQLRLYCYCV